jgi:general secretion pathway protein H
LAEVARRQTLETGISIHNPRFSRQQGFTLWEMIIVVTIISITMLGLTLAPSLSDRDRNLIRVGNDIDNLFEVLFQEAVFENRNFAISVYDAGFHVLEFNGEEWVKSEERFYERVKFTEAQKSLLLIEDLVIDISNKTQPKPHILILASGEMTPFEWRINDSDSDSGIILFGNLLGQVLTSDPAPLS